MKNETIEERITRLVGPDPVINVKSLPRGTEALEIMWRCQDWRTALIKRLAGQAKVMFDVDGSGDSTSLEQDHFYKFSFVAIDFQPIRKGVSKDEIVNALLGKGFIWELLAKRILEEGIIDG